jgi:hypothetical protein
VRLHDHPALTAAQADGDRIAPLFVIDERLQAGRFRSANRLWFMRTSVSALATALEVREAPLSGVRGDPSEIVPAFAAPSRCLAHDSGHLLSADPEWPGGSQGIGRASSGSGPASGHDRVRPSGEDHEPSSRRRQSSPGSM